MAMVDKMMKEAIAEAIFGDPDRPFNFRSLGPEFEIINIEFHRVSKLQTQLRVKTQHNGTHYYDLKLSEQW
jgi:hypothetical protein